ncbi:uncharacterized protein LOC110846836 isoform X2 [Folsomia candida]|uniref:uncharacterized protein LOC110846836 isoform X2 n=1 Tax=Folsomia candida TaxID=158441 RepID=UPI001605571F|nr:uncharacterized protein LOC110846836 isoform X2 [Folsomia candida]
MSDFQEPPLDVKPNSPNSPDEDKTNIRWLVWHSNCMLFGTLVLTPLGMVVSRYFKDTWTLTPFFDRPIWQLVHIVYMISAFVIMVIGVVLGMVYGSSIIRDYTGDENVHRLIGWLTLGLFGIQLFAGIWLPNADESYRYIFRIAHCAIGRITSFVLLILSLLSGMLTAAQFPYFSSVIILFWILFAVVMHICFAYFMHEDDKEILSLEEDGFLMYYRTFLPLPLPALTNKKHKLRGASLRLILYLWFQFGAAAAFIAIFISNSEGYGEYHCNVWEFIQFNCSSYVPHIRY